MVHRIRLREPWKAQSQGLHPSFAYARSFNRPTGIGLNQSIFLDIALLSTASPTQADEISETITFEPPIKHGCRLIAVKLNDVVLVNDSSLPNRFRVNITSHLVAFNSLELEFEYEIVGGIQTPVEDPLDMATAYNIPKLTTLADVAIEIDDVN